jgi:hypothetical protein
MQALTARISPVLCLVSRAPRYDDGIRGRAEGAGRGSLSIGRAAIFQVHCPSLRPQCVKTVLANLRRIPLLCSVCPQKQNLRQDTSRKTSKKRKPLLRLPKPYSDGPIRVFSSLVAHTKKQKGRKRAISIYRFCRCCSFAFSGKWSVVPVNEVRERCNCSHGRIGNLICCFDFCKS